MVSNVVSVRFISGFVFGAGSGVAALKLYQYEEENTHTDTGSSAHRLIERFGLPQTGAEPRFYINHVLSYDQSRRTPRWVAEHLSGQRLLGESRPVGVRGYWRLLGESRPVGVRGYWVSLVLSGQRLLGESRPVGSKVTGWVSSWSCRVKGHWVSLVLSGQRLLGESRPVGVRGYWVSLVLSGQRLLGESRPVGSKVTGWVSSWSCRVKGHWVSLVLSGQRLLGESRPVGSEVTGLVWSCRVRGYWVSLVLSGQRFLSGQRLLGESRPVGSEVTGGNWMSLVLSGQRSLGQADRKHCKFKPDPDIPEIFTARNEDYLRSGWSRGHMAPAGDNKISEQAMAETFYLSNIVPQNYENNAGFWNRLEMYCRDLTQRFSDVWLVSGPLMLPQEPEDGHKTVSYQLIGKDEVAVPTHLFKIILAQRDSSPDSLALGAFVVPNSPIGFERSLTDFQVSLTDVQHMSGLKFFPEVERVEELKNLCEVDSCRLMDFTQFSLYISGRKVSSARTLPRLEKIMTELKHAGIQPDDYLNDLYLEKKRELEEKEEREEKPGP
ncbi:unnamed protein product [Leuciscus chuanchicus]